MDFSSITLEQVNLVMLGIGLFFVAGGLFWGMVRGFKRTAFRGMWLLITALALFFITPLITKMLMNIDLSFTGLEISGVQLTTIKDLIETIAANEGFGDVLTANPVLLELVEKLPGLLINAFLFVLLFWLTKILLWPIWAIITAATFKKRDANGNKLKKKRLLGMLTGVVIGLFIGSVTLMPIVNTLNMVSSVESDTENLTAGSGGIITELAGEDAVTALSYVDQTNMSQVYTYTGFSALSQGMYTYLTTANINGSEVNLQKELKNAIVAYKLTTDLMEYDFDNLTEETINDTLITLDQLVDVVFSIGLVNAIGDDFMPYMLNGLTSGEDFFVQVPSTDDPDMDSLIMQGLTDLSDLQFSDIKNELKSLISVVKTLNDNHIIMEMKDFMESEQEMTLETAQEIATLFPTTLVNDVVDKLFNSKAISIVAPLALVGIVDYAVENANIAELNGFELTTATATQLKTTFSGILNAGVAILNSLDTTSDYYVTSLTISKVGELVDLVRTYGGLSTQSYNMLMNLAENKLNELLNETDTTSLPASIVANISSIISNVSNITSFGDEFDIYANIFDDVLTVYEAVSNQTQINYQTVGEILDAVKSTALIGNQFNSILSNAVDFASDYIPTEFGDFSSVLTTLKANISANINWTVEMPKLGQAVDYVQDLMDEPDVMSVVTTNAGLTEAGQVLDTLKTSALIGNLIPQILNIGIDYATDFLPTEFGDLSSIVASIKANVSNNIVWATELPLFGEIATYAQTKMEDPNAMDTLMTSQGLTEIGGMMDDLKTSQLVGNVIPQIIQFTIDYAADFLPTDFGDLSSIVAGIKANVSNSIVWETELPLLADLIDFGQTSMQDPTFMNNILSSANLSQIGILLDNLQTSALIGNQVNALLATIMTNATDSLDFTSMPQMEGVLEDVITNIENANGTIVWSNEMAHIGEFMELFDQMGSSYELDLIGAGLDSLSGSQLITRSMINDIVIDFVDIALGVDDTSTPATELTDIATIIKNNIVNVTSFEDEFVAMEQFMTDFSSVLDGSTTTGTLNWEDFGANLDSYDKDNGTMHSVLISATRPYIITNIFDLVADGDTTGIVTNIANDVNANAENITSYETEFGYLEDLMDSVTDISTLSLTSLGATMDNLTNSAILFNTGTYVLEYVFDEAIDEATTNGQTNTATALTSMKANALAQVAADTLTYTQAFTQLDDAQTEISALDGADENSDGTTVGTSLDALQALSIVGTANAVLVADTIIETIIGNLSDPTKISQIEALQTAMHNETGTIDFTTNFQNIQTIINA